MSEMINAFSLNADGGQMLNQCQLGCGSFSFLLLKKYRILTEIGHSIFQRRRL